MRIRITRLYRLMVASMVLLVLLLAVGPICAVTPAVNLVLQPANQTVNVGNTLTVSVIAQCGSQTIDGIDVFLDYDPTYLAVQAATAGTTLINILTAPGYDNAAGILKFSAGVQLNSVFPSGTFPVLTITFQVKQATATSTRIDFHTDAFRTTIVDSSGTPVTGTLTGGSYDIRSPATGFSMSGNPNQTAGSAQIITLNAVDSHGEIDSHYSGDFDLTFAGAGSINGHFPTVTNKIGTPVSFGTPATINFNAGVATTSMVLYKVESQPPAITATAANGGSQIAGHTDTITVVPAKASNLVFASAPQTITKNITSAVITIQRLDQFGNPNTTDADVSVDLTSNSTGDCVFRNTSDTVDIASVSIVQGTSSASFKYRDNQEGSPTISATDHALKLTGASQQETITATIATVPIMGGGGFPGGVSSIILTPQGFSQTSDITLSSAGAISEATQLTTKNAEVTLVISKETTLLNNAGGPLAFLRVEVLASPPTPPLNSFIIKAYSFSPDGAEFVPKITLAMSYDPAKLPAGVESKDLYIGYFNDGVWKSLASEVNFQDHVVSVGLSHLSTYALIGPIKEPPASTPTSTSTPIKTGTPTQTKTTTPTSTIKPSSPETPSTGAPISTPTTSQIVQTTPPPSSSLPPSQTTLQPASFPWMVTVLVSIGSLVILTIVLIAWRVRTKKTQKK